MKSSTLLKVKRLCFILFLSLLVSCTKKDEPKEISIDQSELLKNLMENVISPAYQDYKHALSELNASWIANKENLTEEKLTAVREKFKDAYLSWVHCEPFDFGPAKDEKLYTYTAVFPSRADFIEKNIGGESHDFGTVKGFSALDYLFYGKKQGDDYQRATVQEVITQLKTSQARRDYVTQTIKDMVDKIAAVKLLWEKDYGEKFLTSLGVAKESSISNVINDLSKNYELTKNGRLGLPLGKKHLGEKQPEQLEARFSNLSSQLIIESIKSVQNIYLGQSKAGKMGLSFYDWLGKFRRAKLVDGSEQEISKALKDQLHLALESCKAMPEDMYEALANSKADKIETAYAEVQKAVVLIKVDMTSLIGVQIVYADNDGD